MPPDSCFLSVYIIILFLSGNFQNLSVFGICFFYNNPDDSFSFASNEKPRLPEFSGGRGFSFDAWLWGIHPMFFNLGKMLFIGLRIIVGIAVRTEKEIVITCLRRMLRRINRPGRQPGKPVGIV